MLGILAKQPYDRIDAQIDFTDWLSDRDNDTISEVTSSADSDELTVDTPSSDGQIVTQFVSGGIDGKTYVVTVRITTVGNRQLENEFKVKVTER